jgi:hypothetical protein
MRPSVVRLAGCVIATLACSDAVERERERCVGDFAEIAAACPATFDGTPAALPACANAQPTVRHTVHPCHGLLLLYSSAMFAASSCFYDAQSHALVGAIQLADYPAYCDHVSGSIEAGTTDAQCGANTPTLMRECPAPPTP